MQFIMDMVHDNPGEARFETAFRNPEKLIDFGYNAQVFRQNNSTITFEKLGEDFFDVPGGKEWLEKMTKFSVDEIFSAHNAGLMTFCHIDLFVLPKLLVEKYKEEICDENGNISILREKTKELHRVMLDEMFERYPIDGLIIRVGETYLHDTPYHTGNSVIKYKDVEDEQLKFTELIKFLREEICIRHKRFLIFRTWDCHPDKFHANPEYYLSVTNQIEPCDKLFFSIKHTALDFWRRVKFNPCIGIGNHKQIIEVQCQREYEGKGAYPMYNMNGVINGFSEMSDKKGLRDVVDNPLICGIYSWSRGGGWFGPYIKNEFWCDLNAYVICKYGENPKRDEKDIFLEYATERMGLDPENAEKFYGMCLKVPDAVLHGRGIEAFDVTLNESRCPCACWARDDRIAGLRQLNPVFEYLEKANKVENALSEKALAVDLWKEIKESFSEIEMKDAVLREFIENSIEYAICLYTIYNIIFQIFAKCRKGINVKDLLAEYDDAWRNFRELESRNQASSSFCEKFIFSPDCRGLDETIDYCRKNLC